MNDLKGIIEDCNKSDLVSDKIIKKIIEIIGQEEWQDLYDENNNICTTMGELIITLNGIPDLEKENAELKEQMKKFDEGCNIIEELSKFINDCKWYNQHGYEEKQKELIEKVNNFFEGVNYV